MNLLNVNIKKLIGYLAKTVYCLVLFSIIFPSNSLAITTPSTISLQAQLSAGGVINGRYTVYVRLIKNNGVDTPVELYKERFDRTFIQNGVLSVILGRVDVGLSKIEPEDFRKESGFAKYFQIEISEMEGTVEFPVPSTPYAMQAQVAETVLSVSANVISGEFSNPVVLNNDLVVNDTMLIDKGNNVVAIATTNTTALATGIVLNVDGIVNASGYQIDNQDIESLFSWNKRNDILFYDVGNVAIGTDNTEYALEVVGTINAREFRINDVPLAEAIGNNLIWQTRDNGGQVDLFYGNSSTPGNVGVGTSIPLEKLTVDGGIRVGEFTGGTAQGGTIQFINGDFQGYNGSNWVSFTGLQGNGVPQELTFWSGQKTISSTSHLKWDESKNFLSYGLSEGENADAVLDIRARNQVDNLMNIKTFDGNSAFSIVKETSGLQLCPTGYCVGVNKSDPQFSLDVNGIVNADEIFIGGAPLSSSLSSGTFWFQGAERDVYFDLGNVGIGTSVPRSLLEISSKTSDARMTYDIDGQDLFSLGIKQENPDAFIISQGGDLETPVFVFNGDKIGVGIEDPQANLHVSGNSGMIVSGRFGSTQTIPNVDPGTHLMFIPKVAAFRAGFVVDDHWNFSNLGDYSVGMGYDPLAKGDFSVVGGGFRNFAEGDYSTVPGGFNNRAEGDYSFAAGHQALAKHDGTFVWSDYTPSAPVDLSSASLRALFEPALFSSRAPNQFLIKAQNGVGIGTSDTLGSVFTIKKQALETSYMKILDNNDKIVFLLNSSGNISIGSSDPGQATFFVATGGIAIGTTIPTATVDIMPYADQNGHDDLIFALRTNESSGKTAFLVNGQGKIAVGYNLSDLGTQYFNPSLDPDEELFKVNGNIVSRRVLLESEDGSVIELSPNPGSPWGSNSLTGSIFYNGGLVGIGTSNPGSLLELSNSNNLGVDPEITFDIDGVDIYTLGVTLNAPQTDTMFIVSQGGSNTTTPSFAIASQSIGINTDLNLHRATLDVSGNTFVNGKVLVCRPELNCNPNLFNTNFSLTVSGNVNVDQLFEGGAAFEVQDSPWSVINTSVFNGLFVTENVSIGTSLSFPNVALFVDGSVSANNIEFSDVLIDVSRTLNTTTLQLNDSDTTRPADAFSLVRVFNEDFEFCPGGDLSRCRTLSSSLFKAKANTNKGNISFFVTTGATDSDSDLNLGLAETDMFYDNTGPVSSLSVTGNFVVKRQFFEDGLFITSNVKLGGDRGMRIEAELDHDGDLRDIQGYAAQDISIDVLQNWGHPDDLIEIIGTKINIETDENTILLNSARAVGLHVDVGDITTLEGGNKFAALFLGGNVGIGVENPSTELEVAGTVSANFFNLSGALSVNELDVAGDTLVVRSVEAGGQTIPRVGIGHSNPVARGVELSVEGTVSASQFIVNKGITSTTLNIRNDLGPILTVSSNGFIGIGTTNPDGQIVIEKRVNNDTLGDFVSQKIDIDIQGAAPNSIFFFPDDILGMNIDLSSTQVNQLESNVTGLKLDMSDVFANDTSQIKGLDIDVTAPAGNTTQNRYAATFMGGFVGIGTTRPSFNLHVSGNIKASNLILDGFLTTQRATFNFLTVNDTASFNGRVSINNLIVQNTLTVNRLVISDQLSAPVGTVSTLNVANYVSVNTLLEAFNISVNNRLDANFANINALGIGTAPPASGLAVSSNSRFSDLLITNRLDLIDAEFDVNNRTLSIISGNNGVGIGVREPLRPLHLNVNNANAFGADNSDSFNSIKIQNDTTDIGLAAGFVFSPSNRADLSGSGIAAVSEADLDNNTGSGLVFITDPIAGDSQERMRILSNGNVGIGLTNPKFLLDVNGSVKVTNNLIVNNRITVSTISSNGILTITTNGTIAVSGIISSNENIEVEKAVFFKNSAHPVDTSAYGRLYVSSNDLFYMIPSGASVNISKAFTGEAFRVPYFDSEGNLGDDASLFYNSNLDRLILGEDNIAPEIIVSVNHINNVSGDYIGQLVNLNFEDRSLNAGQTTFEGLNINFNSNNPNDPSDFGRLGNGETAVGLNVDMRELRSAQTLPNGTVLEGFKYAASFLGGNVGIGTSLPSSALHIVGERRDLNPFRVDVQSTENVLLVHANGFVGIGTSAPQAKFQVNGDGTDVPVMLIQNSSGGELFRVNQNGRIAAGGIVDPSVAFEIAGTISANATSFGTVTGTTLNIGQGNLFVDASGNVSIGTTVSEGNFTFRKNIRSDNLADIPANGFTSEKLSVTVGQPSLTQQFFFNNNLTGLDVNLLSDSSSFIGSDVAVPGSPTVFATGVSVNMSDLNLRSNAKAVGLFVDVTAPEGDEGSRFAAVFNGGNVGIGTSNPRVALDVSGSIRAVNLTLSGTVSANAATFNRLVVNGDALFSGDVTANNFFANTASVNNLIVSGNININQGTFSTINVTNQALISKLGVGVNSFTSNEALFVSGNTFISGNLTISENGTLFVDNIRSVDSLTLNIVANTIQVDGSVSMNQSSVELERGLFFAPATIPSGTSPKGLIMVDENGQLVYRKPDSATFANLSFTGTPNHIAHFDSEGKLSSAAPILWLESSKTLQIGKDNLNGSLTVSSTYNQTVSGETALQEINMLFDNRAASATQTEFTGLDIVFDSLNKTSATNFGRLGQDETAIGLKVDVRNLFARQSSGAGATIQATKNAAVFLGGNVGIGTTLPNAALHIVGEVPGNKALQVDVRNTENVLVVAGNGNVGIGLDQPTAKLHVKNDDGNENIFVVENDSDIVFAVKSDQSLDVAGTLNITNLDAALISGNIINIGQGNFFVSTNGNVGFGDSDPQNNFSFLKNITAVNAPTNPFISQKININLGEDTAAQQFYFDQNITGLDVNLSSAVNNFYGGLAGAASIARGMSIDTTGLELNTASVIQGLFVDVTAPAGNTDGDRFAAIFRGGNVGIGTTPNVALDVSGNLRATNLSIEGVLTVDTATFNQLIVNQLASFNNDVSINRLEGGTFVVSTINILNSMASTTLNTSELLVDATANIVLLNTTTVNATQVSANTLIVDRILNLNNQNILISPNAGSLINIVGNLNVSDDIRISESLTFTNQTNHPDAILESGQLYILNNDLLFTRPRDANTVNITESLTGPAGAVSFATPEGLVSTINSPLWWIDSSKTFKVGTGNMLSRMNIENALPNDFDDDFVAQSISMNIGNRAALAAGRVIKGLDIAFNPEVGQTARLAENEQLFGLVVDVSDIEAEFSTLDSIDNDGARKGYKSAAQFIGGSVGVGINDPAFIRASLHVKSEDKDVNPFTVDSFSTQNVLVASSAGFVGIGTAVPNAAMHILQQNDKASIFNVAGLNQESIFRINEDGKVLFFEPTNIPSANFHIEKPANNDDNILLVKGSQARMIIDNEGQLLLNNQDDAPSSNLHVKQINTDDDIFKVSLLNSVADGQSDTALVVNELGNVGIRVSDPQYQLQVDGVVAIGTPNAGLAFQNIPVFLQADRENTKGFLANRSTTNVFLGLDNNKGVLFSSHDFSINTQDANGIPVPALNIIAQGVSQNFIGIGTLTPNAQLHISSDTDNKTLFFVDSHDANVTDGLLTITSKNIGIRTSTPNEDFVLDVKGKAHIDHLVIDSGSLVVSTLNIESGLSLVRRVTNSDLDSKVSSFNILLDNDLETDIYGLNINMSSIEHADYGDPLRRYVLYDEAEAIGIKVDMSDLRIGDALLQSSRRRVSGKKYAGVFKGGFVGIGTSSPEFPLHVHINSAAPFGNSNLDVARFSSVQSDLTLRADSEPGHFSFLINRSDDTTNTFKPLNLATSLDASGINSSRVGIGTARPNEALHVNGDIRLGLRNNTIIASGDETPTEGAKLFFSGAAKFNSSINDGDNTDPIFINRVNHGLDHSELRISVGNDSDNASNNDAFIVGFTDGGTFQHVMNVKMNRRVGISDGSDSSFEPLTTLHIMADKSGANNRVSDHVVLIENTSTEQADTLAIRHTANWEENGLNEHSHFIDFFGGEDLLGFVGANGIRPGTGVDGIPSVPAGVRYVSQGADYAEYLEKEDPKMKVERGDILGVKNGILTKDTSDAQLIMVKSSAASVAGNLPSESEKYKYELVAFFGQVPVKVFGKVNKGDFIFPSGKNDGTGIAISEEDIETYPQHLIVGRAWESSSKKSMKYINVAVGFNFALPNMGNTIDNMKTLSNKIKELQEKDNVYTDDIESRLAKQNQEIQELVNKVNLLSK